MFLFLCLCSHFVLIYHSFTPVFPTHALGPVSVSPVQASVFFPLNPSPFHPSVLAHISHTFTLILHISSFSLFSWHVLQHPLYCSYIKTLQQSPTNFLEVTGHEATQKPWTNGHQTSATFCVSLKRFHIIKCFQVFRKVSFSSIGTVSLGSSLLCQSTELLRPTWVLMRYGDWVRWMIKSSQKDQERKDSAAKKEVTGRRNHRSAALFLMQQPRYHRKLWSISMSCFPNVFYTPST